MDNLYLAHLFLLIKRFFLDFAYIERGHRSII